MKQLLRSAAAPGGGVPVRLIGVLTALCLLTLWQVSAKAGVLQNIRAYEGPDHTRVVLDTDSKADYTLMRLENPDRLVIDLRSTNLASPFQPETSKAIGTGKRIVKLRRAEHDDFYRVVLDLRQSYPHNSFELKPLPGYGHRLVIDLFDPSPAERTPLEPGKLIIAVDAGHGGEDPGAIGPNRLYEKQVVLSMARKLADRFNRTPGYRAVLIRTGDYYVPLRKRARLARDHKANLFLSLHADAFRDSRVHGASVFMLSEKGADSESARAKRENLADLNGGVDVVRLDDKPDPLRQVLIDKSIEGYRLTSHEVGEEILTELDKVTSLHKKQIGHAAFAVLKIVDAPGLLIETGFITNPREARKLNQKEHQDRIVTAIHRGVVRYWKENPMPGIALAAAAPIRP